MSYIAFHIHGLLLIFPTCNTSQGPLENRITDRRVYCATLARFENQRWNVCFCLFFLYFDPLLLELKRNTQKYGNKDCSEPVFEVGPFSCLENQHLIFYFIFLTRARLPKIGTFEKYVINGAHTRPNCWKWSSEECAAPIYLLINICLIT